MNSAPKILLVDDDLTQLKLNRIRLMDAGFDVATATGGVEALALARRQPPDAIVSDVLMGELDGFGFCRLVRNEPALAEVPIVLFSAHYRGEPDQDLALRVGASALVARTADFDDELEAVRKILGTHCPPPGGAVDAAVYEQHLRANATQLSRMLGKARNAEERSRTLFETATDLIALLDADGVIVDANPRWHELLDVAPAQLLGRHIGDFAVPGHEREHLDEFRRSLDRGAGRTAVVLRRADGDHLFVEFSFTVVDVDGRPMMFTIGRDVTEQTRALQRLAAAEERYRTLVERIPDVIWTAREDGDLMFVTRNSERVLGFTAAEMCAATLDERAAAIHPDDQAAVVQAFHACVAGRGPFDLEYRRRRPDGTWMWVRNRAIARYERDGVRYVEGIFSDVTARRRLEEQVAHAEKMDAIGKLTGGIAHDFNNILAAIVACSHFLMEDLAENDPRRPDAVEIKRSAERAAALTRQLLAFSRRQVLAPTVTDLNAAVRDLERMLRRLIAEDIKLVVRPGPALGVVRVDVGQLEQVIMNLVVNARDAMPRGGTLTISTRNAGDHVCLAVEDTGCGMDEETQRRMFEPFFTTKEVGRGTGLGLSTCYGIVKQSGGHIEVRSAPGLGSTFEIHLPVVDGAPEQARISNVIQTMKGGETILVIEDDPRVRKAIVRMLRSRGYEVLSACDGDEAMAVVAGQQGAIDLILSDVVMPGASGPEVVARARLAAPGARALFMSGHHDHPALRGDAVGGEQHFIQKPFTPDALAKKLRDVLDADMVDSMA